MGIFWILVGEGDGDGERRWAVMLGEKVRRKRRRR
jgi:hypothetical protein